MYLQMRQVVKQGSDFWELNLSTTLWVSLKKIVLFAICLTEIGTFWWEFTVWDLFAGFTVIFDIFSPLSVHVFVHNVHLYK